MRSVNQTALDALANQRGTPILRVLTWASLAAYNAAPTVPEHTWLTDGFDILSTSANASIISPDNDYTISGFTVFIIERGIVLNGTEYPVQSGLYFVRQFKETPGRIKLQGSSFPNSKIVLTGDDTYQNVITAFCTAIGKTAVFRDPTESWLGYQFFPVGKQVVLNKSERFENLLRQKYTIGVYERSPKVLVFYVTSRVQSTWKDVTWADSQFVIAADTGSDEFALSSDGVGWARQSAPSYAVAVAYSASLDLFAAVGTNICMTSPDGITWTSRTIGTGTWKDVVWSVELSLFVAVSIGGAVATSANGTTWTITKVGDWSARIITSSDYQSIAWSPTLGKFVAVSRGGTIRTSTDGITWSATVSNPQLTAVCWSPALAIFCAVYQVTGGNQVYTSADGSTWTARTAAEADEWRAIAWSPSLGLFVAVGSPDGAGTGSAMSSPDGITWTLRTSSGTNTGWGAVCWSPELGRFVATAISGTNKAMYSDNGTSWTIATAPLNTTSVCWSSVLSLFIAVGSAGAVMTSPTGLTGTWTSRTAAENNNWESVCAADEIGLLVAVSSTGTNRCMTSPDGITWTAKAAAEANQWQSVVWSPTLGLFAAVGDSGTNRAMTLSVPAINANAIAWSGAVAAAVGTSAAYSSANGTTWTLRTIPAGTYNAVVFGNSLFVAVGSSTKCATSPDGITWTARTIPAGSYTGVEWASALSLFVAVGNGVISTSPDGITWTARTVPAANNWQSVAWSSTLALFLVVSSDGANRLATSADGITWSLLTTLADFSLEYDEGTEFSIMHGLSDVHFLWRDEAATTHTEGDTGDPAWNLGYLESTDSPPGEHTDPFYKFTFRKAPIRLDITDGDRIHFSPNWTLDPTKTIDASVLVAEHFKVDHPPTWWQDISSIALFEHTEGGSLPGTIERVAAYTPLVSSGFDGNLTPDVNNLQALAQAVDDMIISALSQEDIEDFVGAMLTGNTETGIVVTYDDGTAKINFVAEVTQAELDAVNAAIPTTEQIQDIIGAMFTGNTETGIAATYEDTDGTIDLVVSGGSGGAVPHEPGGRLTLVTGLPVMTSDQTAKTTIYYTPYMGDLVPIYDGTVWTENTFTELSLALSADSGHTGYHQADKNFDLFVYNDAGTLRLVSGPAWTSDTVRATALEYKNGMLMNAASMTARFGSVSGNTVTVAQDRGTYVGTFRASANGQTVFVFAPAAASGGNECKIWLWNMYNRVSIHPLVRENVDSWTYNSTTVRAANNSNNNRVSMVRGIDEDDVTAIYSLAFVGGASGDYMPGIAIDSTSTYVKGTYGSFGTLTAPGTIAWAGKPGLGYHYIQAVEKQFTTASIATAFGKIAGSDIFVTLSVVLMA